MRPELWDLDLETAAVLRACADRDQIENILGLYCRAVDRLDVELLKSIYHPDAIDDHGALVLNAHEFAEQIIAVLSQVCIWSMHTITHSVIDLNGLRATAESYYIGYHTIQSGKEAIGRFFGAAYAEAQRRSGGLGRQHEYICAGRYLDVFEKRQDRWKILKRTITNEYQRCQPAAESREGMPAAYWKPGRRDGNDPVYRLLSSEGVRAPPAPNAGSVM